ncbi:MAG: hypothetical protein U5J83_09770 [Bryobacterales bacterium]|nr:hypothetical protein [Bryobacterales bacterium]
MSIERPARKRPPWKAGFRPPFAGCSPAVGLGRAELFPFSDIDLVFVHPPEASPEALRAVVRPVTQTLWDLGLEPFYLFSQSARGNPFLSR